MTTPATPPDPPLPPLVDAEEGSVHWRRNLLVCVIGSFTTIVAMTLILPFLPLYVAQLGVKDNAAVLEWSGATFAGSFVTAALFAPLWGHLADRYGRKLMLIRASLGMTVAVMLMGFVTNVWQLAASRLLVGVLGGYASGSNVLVATQTPKNRTGWALGILASGIMAGSLAGPLIGGALPPLIGIRATFWLSSASIFVTFLMTTFMIKEERVVPPTRAHKEAGTWSRVPDRRPVVAMLVTGVLLMVAIMSIEPIITAFVQELVQDASRVTMTAGVVMSATALGSILAAPRLGKLADRIGHWRVLTAGLWAAALLVVPQAFVTAGWQLVGLRFLMGIALGALSPCITAVIRHSAPRQVAGTLLGWSISSQYVGQVVGPLMGGFVGGHLGLRPVFLVTSALLVAGALFNGRAARRAAVPVPIPVPPPGAE